jgi:hypothetical protein
MKKNLKAGFFVIPVLALSIALLGFKSPAGGEGYEIYLDNKLVVRQFGSTISQVTSVTLDKTAYNSRLVVKYWHCGRVAKNRQVTLKNGEDKVLLQWNFPDKDDAAIGCAVKDIMDLKTGSGTLKLYYSSSELPKGRQLAAIHTTAGVLSNP